MERSIAESLTRNSSLYRTQAWTGTSGLNRVTARFDQMENPRLLHCYLGMTGSVRYNGR
jgi:hypothetical protein